MQSTKQGTRLTGLSEKIFLDRYALKRQGKYGVNVGETVLVLVKDDSRFPQKEVGEVTAVDGDRVTVRLRNGETWTGAKELLTVTIEKTPEEMWKRLAKAMASVEATPEKRDEWTEKFRVFVTRLEAGSGRPDCGRRRRQRRADAVQLLCHSFPARQPRRHHGDADRDDGNHGARRRRRHQPVVACVRAGPSCGA